MTQPNLFDPPKPKPEPTGYCHDLDAPRLNIQRNKVLVIMQIYAKGNYWATLGEISGMVNAPEASVSARLRDLRKPRYGGWTVSKRRRGDPKAGLWEYLLRKSS